MPDYPAEVARLTHELSREREAHAETRRRAVLVRFEKGAPPPEIFVRLDAVPDEERWCAACDKWLPFRFRPSPDAGPFWRCSECGEPETKTPADVARDSERQAAGMREALTAAIVGEGWDGDQMVWVCECGALASDLNQIAHEPVCPLSSSAGRDWHSPEEWEERERDASVLAETLRGIAHKSRFDRTAFDSVDEFAVWAQSRAKAVLASNTAGRGYVPAEEHERVREALAIARRAVAINVDGMPDDEKITATLTAGDVRRIRAALDGKAVTRG